MVFYFWRMTFEQRKILDLKVAAIKIRRYCAYQERSQNEVLQKLRSYGLLPGIVDDMLIALIEEGFVNEERFAIAFARGKVNIKRWGKRKIEIALKQHGVGKPCIATALTAINEDAYIENLERLAKKKYNSLSGGPENIKWQKTIKYLAEKGYFYDEIESVINSLKT